MRSDSRREYFVLLVLYRIVRMREPPILRATKLHPASNLTPFDGFPELFLGAFEDGVFRGRDESI